MALLRESTYTARQCSHVTLVDVWHGVVVGVTERSFVGDTQNGTSRLVTYVTARVGRLVQERDR